MRAERRGVALLGLLFAPAALASDLVVHAELGANAAVAQVAEDAQVPPDGLEAVTLPELFLGRSPVVVGQGALHLCSVPPMAATAVAEAGERAESNVLYVDYTAALADIAAATQALGCLREAAQAEDAARLYFLAGVIASERQDEDTAFTAFRQAHVYAPGLAWDEDFPPDARALFDDAARSAQSDPPMRFAVKPLPRDTQVLVDGRPIARPDLGFELATGEHLVQLVGATITTVRVTLDAGEAQLFVPNAVAAEDAHDFTIPERAAALSALVATVAGSGRKTYVALPTGTWAGSAGDAEFARISTRDPASGRRKQKRTLQIAGGAVALGGAALAGASFAQGRALIGQMEDPSVAWADYQAAAPRYDGARTRLLVGEGVLGAGLVVAGVGLALPLGPRAEGAK